MTAIVSRTQGLVRAGAEESPGFRVDLRYDNTDPHAIAFEFYGTKGDSVVWIVGLSLFSDTTARYSTPQAKNCVTVTFDMALNELFLHLMNDGEETIVVLPADEVLRFIMTTRPLMTKEVVTAARDVMIGEFEALLADQ